MITKEETDKDETKRREAQQNRPFHWWNTKKYQMISRIPSHRQLRANNYPGHDAGDRDSGPACGIQVPQLPAPARARAAVTVDDHHHKHENQKR